MRLAALNVFVCPSPRDWWRWVHLQGSPCACLCLISPPCLYSSSNEHLCQNHPNSRKIRSLLGQWLASWSSWNPLRGFANYFTRDSIAVLSCADVASQSQRSRRKNNRLKNMLSIQGSFPYCQYMCIAEEESENMSGYRVCEMRT